MIWLLSSSTAFTYTRWNHLQLQFPRYGIAPCLCKLSCHDLECPAPTSLCGEVLPLKTRSNSQTFSIVFLLYPFLSWVLAPSIFLEHLTCSSVLGYIYLLAWFSSSLNEHTLCLIHLCIPCAWLAFWHIIKSTYWQSEQMNKWTNKNYCYIKLWTYWGLGKVHCFKDETHLRGHLNDFSTHKAELKAIIFQMFILKKSQTSQVKIYSIY